MHLLNPWFLLGAIAIAVPILIHILQRHRIRRVVFPAARFLMGASRAITRSQQMRELILMILRAGVVALAVAAFVRPFLASGKDAAASGGHPGTAAVVLVDVSASMRIGARMDDARAQALAYLAGLRAGIDRVALVAIDAETSVRVPMTDDPEQVRAAVKLLQPGWGAGDLSAALRVCDRLLQSEEYADSARRIVVVSDLQKSGWSPANADWRLATGTTIDIKPVSTHAADNVAITKVAVPQGAVASPRLQAISAQVANLGSVDHPGLVVALTLAGKPVAEKTVSLGAGKTEVVRFDDAFVEPGDVAGAIAVHAQDDFPDDDTWYLDVRVRPRVQVLLVNGGANPSAALDDGRFVRESLSLRASPFEVREIAPADFSAADLSGRQAVVFANVGAISSDANAAVKAFIAGGGGVLIFCGDHVAPAAFNAAFAGIAPCQVREVAAKDDASAGWTFGEVDLQHPIFAAFSTPQSGDLGGARFSKYCTVADSQTSRVVARFIDGRPALLESTLGAGTALLFTSTAGMAWSDFCLQGGVFVPFIHEALKYVSVHSDGASDLAVGEPLGPAGSTATRLQPDAAAPAGPLAQAPGIYRIDAAGRSTEVAVNLVRTESETAALDPAELAAAVTSDPLGRERAIDGAKVWVAASASVRERIEGAQRIGFYLLIGVLILLIAEHLLANHTSRT